MSKCSSSCSLSPAGCCHPFRLTCFASTCKHSVLRRGVSVMEDEGVYSDHTSGIAATDGTWHHIAVTWQSSDGRTSLYDNGRKVKAPICAPAAVEEHRFYRSI